MNNKILQHRILKILLAAIMIAAFGSTALGRQTERGYVLIVRQSPADSGIVTPSVGIYRPELNQTVVIQALPKLGYKFIYWMGDVLSPTSNRTSVRLDSPKIVIAIFEKESFELLSPSNVSTSGAGGGQAITKPQESAGEPVMYDGDDDDGDDDDGDDDDDDDDSNIIPVPGNDFEIPVPGGDFEIPVPGDGSDIPVPGDGSDIPVPGSSSEVPVPDDSGGIPDIRENMLPEPATMAMLAAGTIFLRKRNRRRTK